MKKIPLKWRFFLIACYVQLILAGLFLVAIIIRLFQATPIKDFIILLTLIIGGLIFTCANNFLNIYKVHYFFPATPAPKTYKRIHNAGGILQVITWIGLFLLCLFGFIEVLDTSPKEELALILLFILSFIWFAGVFTLVLQTGMSSFIRRNNKAAMKQMIDETGTKPWQ